MDGTIVHSVASCKVVATIVLALTPEGFMRDASPLILSRAVRSLGRGSNRTYIPRQPRIRIRSHEIFVAWSDHAAVRCFRCDGLDGPCACMSPVIPVVVGHEADLYWLRLADPISDRELPRRGPRESEVLH